MRKFFESAGGRKLLLVGVALLVAVLNKKLGLDLSEETIQTVVYGSVGGSTAIALEDALKSLFVKEKKDA
jgi:hypothetical protein